MFGISKQYCLIYIFYDLLRFTNVLPTYSLSFTTFLATNILLLTDFDLKYFVFNYSNLYERPIT